MHLVGTNISLWIHIVVKESILEINHAEHITDSSNSTYDSNGENDEDTPFCDGFESDILGEGTLSMVNPYLFPLAIEFALIGAIFFYHMFKTVEKR